jgi:hypothetical protein
MIEPLTDAYLQECEYRARRFSGAYFGTAGALAADVIRLLAERRRLLAEIADLRSMAFDEQGEPDET